LERRRKSEATKFLEQAELYGFVISGPIEIKAAHTTSSRELVSAICEEAGRYSKAKEDTKAADKQERRKYNLRCKKN